MIYEKIYEFCKVRNEGNCYKNGPDPTPRVRFLMNLLDKEGIKYEIDSWTEEREDYSFRWNFDRRKRKPEVDIRGRKDYFRKIFRDYDINDFDDEDNLDFFDEFDEDSFDLDSDKKVDKKEDTNELFFWDEDEKPKDVKKITNHYYNIIIRGTSNKMIVAHHDVNNHTIDNANDNSCSVINAIATKKLKPEINVVLLDGEEFGGKGSDRLGKQIKDGKFGNIEWVLNFELTGKGGKYFFIGNYPGKLSNRIVELFKCPIVFTPFNDSIVLRRHGIDSTVINPVPPMPEGKKSDVIAPDGTYLDTSILHHCHSPKDTVSNISPDDMKEFVEDVVLKIIG